MLAEFALAILSDVLGRLVGLLGLVDSLLSDRLTMSSFLQLMEDAATLNLEDFEDAEFQDELERAPPSQWPHDIDGPAVHPNADPYHRCNLRGGFGVLQFLAYLAPGYGADPSLHW